MKRPTRYAIALLAAGIVTVLSAQTTESPVLLAGIGQTYGIATAVGLRPDVRLAAGSHDSFAGTVFTGAAVFGVVSLANGVTSSFDVGVAILATGLVYMGFICGTWAGLDGGK